MSEQQTEQKTLTKQKVSQYTLWNVLPEVDRMSVPSEKKLVYLQVTPVKAVKEREIAGKKIPYVSIDYIERCLNFVSNFNRWIEIVDKWFIEFENANKKIVYEARVQAKCYIYLWEKRIERTVFGSRVAYSNPAVSRFAVYESAKSIATKSFADTFWIGSDKIADENNAIKKLKEEYQEVSINQATDWFSK